MSSVRAVAIAPDGRRAVSAAGDRTIKLWELTAAHIVSTFTPDGSPSCCCVAGDGITVVAGDSLGRVHFLRIEGLDTAS